MSKKDAPEILRRLKKHYPHVECALTHSNALQLLIATILSAQCTDERVNKVTPALFAKYKTAKEFFEAKISDLEKLIYSTGFYRNKAKNIQGACRKIHEKFNGEVPNNMVDLLTLPGVARKTANVVLAVWFKIYVGVVVDTHVGRISQRLGLTKYKSPVKIEQDLMKLVPQQDWEYISLSFITLGRKICLSQNPKCGECFLNDICPSAFKDTRKPMATRKKTRTSKM